VGDLPEAAAFFVYQSVSARCCARIDAQNLHAVRLGIAPDVPSPGEPLVPPCSPLLDIACVLRSSEEPPGRIVLPTSGLRQRTRRSRAKPVSAA
jgi:hypothetical protein